MLAEKIVAAILKNPESLNMEHFSSECGASFCLAGHILKAFGVGIVAPAPSWYLCRLADDAPVPDAKWVDFESRIADRVAIPALARQVWAAEYGDDSAKRLPFYHENWESGLTSVELFDDDGQLQIARVTLNDLADRVPEIGAALKAATALGLKIIDGTIWPEDDMAHLTRVPPAR